MHKIWIRNGGKTKPLISNIGPGLVFGGKVRCVRTIRLLAGVLAVPVGGAAPIPRFYACGPSMQHFGVSPDEFIFDDVTVCEYLTFLEVMRSADTALMLQ